MTIQAWRITQMKHAKSAFSGEGARLYGGRWNSPGTAVIYAAQSQALAVLEVLVHLDSPELLKKYVLFEISIEAAYLRELDPAELPRNWKVNPPPPSVQSIGDAWIARSGSAVMQVPSTLLPAESNYLLNPAHPDFKKLTIGKAQPFQFDFRLTRRPR